MIFKSNTGWETANVPIDKLSVSNNGNKAVLSILTKDRRKLIVSFTKLLFSIVFSLPISGLWLILKISGRGNSIFAVAVKKEL